MRESELQTKIIRQLESDGWMVVKLIQTSCNGVPDLMALRNGRTVFIEVKAPGKVPKPLQMYRHNKLREKGFTVLTIDDINKLCL